MGEQTRNEVLLVQHHPADAPGAIARELRARAVPVRDVRGYEGDEIPTSVAGLLGLVVMGGPMAADDVETYPFLASEQRLVEAALDAQIPVLGVCLGAQILALALGGAVARGAASEIGWHEVERVETLDPLFDGVPPTFRPFHWHEDSIALPPGATLLARSRVTAVQAFRKGEAYGLQFHLESDRAMVEAMVRGFGGGQAVAKQATLDTPACLAEQERLAAAVFGRWAEGVARAAAR
jgi:GMP synthase-like glutamine amidotransferase